MFKFFAIILLVFGFLATNVVGSANIQTTTYDGIPENFGGGIDSNPFVKIGTQYYIVETQKEVSWYKAAHICREHNAHLANIQSEVEMNALSNYLVANGHSTKRLWISGNDLDEENKFFSLASGKPIGYTRWSPGQPDNYGKNENCIMLWIHANAFYMNDGRCSSKVFYICQANEPKTVVFTVW